MRIVGTYDNTKHARSGPSTPTTHRELIGEQEGKRARSVAPLVAFDSLTWMDFSAICTLSQGLSSSSCTLGMARTSRSAGRHGRSDERRVGYELWGEEKPASEAVTTLRVTAGDA